ncbi:MAG: hypothetical protein ABL901_20235 [Hyphomicrobiaceae bacterium]
MTIVPFHRLKPDQLSFQFRKSIPNAVFKSAHLTLVEYRQVSGAPASRAFAEGQLPISDDGFGETEQRLCMAEFERLGLIPPA